MVLFIIFSILFGISSGVYVEMHAENTECTRYKNAFEGALSLFDGDVRAGASGELIQEDIDKKNEMYKKMTDACK